MRSRFGLAPSAARISRWAGVCLSASVLGALLLTAAANNPLEAAPKEKVAPPGPPLVLAKQRYLFMGGQYDNPANPTQMSGQTYVEYQIPVGDPKKVPIVMIHGGGHTGVGWIGTPDGRMGW